MLRRGISQNFRDVLAVSLLMRRLVFFSEFLIVPSKCSPALLCFYLLLGRSSKYSQTEIRNYSKLEAMFHDF